MNNISKKEQTCNNIKKASLGVAGVSFLASLFTDSKIAVLGAFCGVATAVAADYLQKREIDKVNQMSKNGKLICPACNRALGNCRHTREEIISMLESVNKNQNISFCRETK